MADFVSDIKETSEILGKEKIDCLINLFKQTEGKPPCVEKKRYRANNPNQIDILNYLEQSANLIATKHTETKQFYHLSPYAIPLIKDAKAGSLLKLMCEIYGKLSIFYKERLDENVTRDELIKAVDAPDEKALEALYYIAEAHSVWTGKGNGFPYEKDSYIKISEDVILKESLLEVLTNHYCWNFLNKKDDTLNTNRINNITVPDTKVETKKVGRPNSEKDLIAAYKFLKKNNKIDFNNSLKAHAKLIKDTVLSLRQSDDASGTNYKTICKYLSNRFELDKQSIN